MECQSFQKLSKLSPLHIQETIISTFPGSNICEDKINTKKEIVYALKIYICQPLHDM